MNEEFTEWDYPGDFLKQFPVHHTGVVGDIFCRQAREGNRTVDALLHAVGEMAAARLANPYPGDNDENLGVRRQLLDALTTLEAARFARFILWRESLSHEERDSLKSASRTIKGGFYAKQAMAVKPPTGKQLALLKSKRCAVIPRTRLEASELIDNILNG